MHWNVRELHTKRAERAEREREVEGEGIVRDINIREGRKENEYRKGGKGRAKVDIGRERGENEKWHRQKSKKRWRYN